MDTRIGIGGAHIVLPPVPGRPATLYFVIDAATEAAGPRRLEAVTVDGVARAEMHQSMTMHGMARMRPLASVSLADGATRFCPGGNHVMLFDLDPRIVAASRARVQFRFDGGQQLSRDAVVVPFGQQPRAQPPFDCAEAR